MLIDSHCHIYKEYYDDIDKVIKEANDKGVTKFINNGTDNKSNKEVLALINQYDNMYGALGIHPESVLEYSLSDIKFIEDNLSNPKVIAIGEIGLDYHYSKEEKDEQIKLFELQLSLAEKYHIPVIVHSRDATLDTINTLKKYHVKGVIHSFSGSIETAKEYIKMGFLLGVNGVITFKNANLKEVIKNVPLESLLLETDSPYLTPEPYRGTQNNPGHIFDIATFVANLFNISITDLSHICANNFNKLFLANNDK